MKVQVWRSGGLLGRRVEWDVIVDEQPDPEAWYILIAELPWHERPRAMTMPDRYTYEIHCAPNEAVIPEKQLIGPWRELVDRVRDANANAKPKPEPEPDDSQPPKTPENAQPSDTVDSSDTTDKHCESFPDELDGER